MTTDALFDYHSTALESCMTTTAQHSTAQPSTAQHEVLSST